LIETPIEEDPEVVASYLEVEVLEASFLGVEALSCPVEAYLEVAFLEVVVLSYLVEEACLEVAFLEVEVHASFLEVLEEVLSLVVEVLVQALEDIQLEALEFHGLEVTFEQVLGHQLLVLVHSNQEVLL